MTGVDIEILVKGTTRSSIADKRKRRQIKTRRIIKKKKQRATV